MKPTYEDVVAQLGIMLAWFRDHGQYSEEEAVVIEEADAVYYAAKSSQ